MIVKKWSRDPTRSILFVGLFMFFENWVLCFPSELLNPNDQSADNPSNATEALDLTVVQSQRGTNQTINNNNNNNNNNNRESKKQNVRSEKATTMTALRTGMQSDNLAESQNFFQSFAPLFGNNNNSPLSHSRPLLYPEHSFKPAFKMGTYRELPVAAAAAVPASLGGAGANENILGSGNFGVVKGGTYYAEERDDADFTTDNDPYSFLGSTHGRVYKKNPPPAFRNGGDFFAHFRDFADITAPSKSYSQYYVVYVNKNATINEVPITKPKQANNIIEQLSMLDSPSASAHKPEQLMANVSAKLSKFKQKLLDHQTKNNEKEVSLKQKVHDPPKEIAEPLLALS